MSAPSRFTIQGCIESLSDELKQYLEAQYHVRDDSVVRERKLLFDDGDTIAQDAFLEATPAYESGKRFCDLNIPVPCKELLAQLAGLDIGVFDPPYVHQQQALENFIGQKKDIIASTGTGSGKTEIFLYSIFAAFAEQAVANPNGVEKRGMRALILYPMNALVADQLSRMRNIIGNERSVELLNRKFGRHLTFGMYTGRTPFPGDIGEERNKRRAKELLDKYVQPILDNPSLLDQLKRRGKWPAKDMLDFFGQGGRWSSRLKTSASDAELFMRHEMQSECPDVLITNYSMLEYMLLRPIERSIFQSTMAYLEQDDSYLTFVLDEAHMYRGTTGAEVAYLIRRLMSRLRIGRDKVRFILTTASVGKKPADRDAAIAFADKLTSSIVGNSRFVFIKGTPETLATSADANQDAIRALAAFDVHQLRQHSQDLEPIRPKICQLVEDINAGKIQSTGELPDELYKALFTYGPACKLIRLLSGKATRFDDIAKTMFPEQALDVARAALDCLLALTNAAKDSKKGKVLLPARLHLFMRGIAGMYACVNPGCTNRRSSDADTTLLGRLYAEPRITCDCGCRVFEILTHRDCGAAFFRGFAPTTVSPEFLWNEPANHIGQDSQTMPFSEMELFLPTTGITPTGTRPVWLQLASGRLSWQNPQDDLRWRLVFVYDQSASTAGAPAASVFHSCPACARRVRQPGERSSRIMDLRTKGEQPFGHIIKQQLVCQPTDQNKPKEKFPNQGRKVLVFSDGRQKAARLAQSLPQELGSDCFRELLVVGSSQLRTIGKVLDSFPLTKWYTVFVAACSQHHLYLFEKADARILLGHIRHFQNRYGGDLEYALDNDGITDPPISFKRMLYKQTCSPLYSLPFLSAGWLAVNRRYLGRNVLPRLQAIPNFGALSVVDQEAIVLSWIHELARDLSIDIAFSDQFRPLIAMYNRPTWSHNGRFPRVLQKILADLGIDHATVSAALVSEISEQTADGGVMLRPSDLSLVVNLENNWWSCSSCATTTPMAISGRCPSCGSQNGRLVDPNTDVYTVSRKGFWRSQLRKVQDGEAVPLMVHTEEHTAQLTHKDSAQGQTLSEVYELRFQDITVDPHVEPPIDVLSCTTTMEVGIDIGSLTAVALRNVPPQRENYQQRAGRAGRRGASLSTVVTYCQGNAHDNYYFSNVSEIAAGDPRQLYVTIDNEKIARRHVHSYLLQQFFAQMNIQARDMMQSLGTLQEFFATDGSATKSAFLDWLEHQFLLKADSCFDDCIGWLRTGISHVGNLELWLQNQTRAFIQRLLQLEPIAHEIIQKEVLAQSDDPTTLLDFLFQHSQLPTYAFPTSLSTFAVESWSRESNRIVRDYAPQQSISRALTEYAPGRLVTIDKNTYRSAVVTANVSPFEVDRAERLFNDPTRKPYVFCSSLMCSYVEDAGKEGASRDGHPCPLCKTGVLNVKELITPECFLPLRGKPVNELDDESEFSFATPAQFPVPMGGANGPLENAQQVGIHGVSGWWNDAELVVVNKGDPDSNSGFHVCTKCGIAELATAPPMGRGHERPYRVQGLPGQALPPTRCNGDIVPVFLGSRFRSDLLLIQVDVAPPLHTTVSHTAPAYLALNDALQTLSESLPLAIAKRYDLDYTEFSAGYRIRDLGGTIAAELYLYDTLSGGAGYAQKAGEEIGSILQAEVMQILSCEESAQKGCQRSCYRCLRHYHNQFMHTKLDRFLARDLLNWILFGAAPIDKEIADQAQMLKGLAEMLQFDGLEVKSHAIVDNFPVPLVVSQGNARVVVGLQHGLLMGPVSATAIDHVTSCQTRLLNEYQVSRNLPICYQTIKQCLLRA